MFKVVALSGWKKSGKDTAGDYLVRKYGATKLSFAAPLKDLVAKQYDIPRDWCDNKFKEFPLKQYPVKSVDGFSKNIHDFMWEEFKDINGNTPLNPETSVYWTPRSLLIFEGSGKRAVNPQYWVKQVTDQIDTVSNKLYVISDVRFKSELQELSTLYGDNLVTVRINRFDKNPSKDPSENDLDNTKFDVYLENKGTFEHYYQTIDETLISKMNNE